MDPMVHHNFIITTDRRSTHTQIKTLVTKAQEVAEEDLQSRRAALKNLLEYEDKIYEEEFASKVKSRIDEDIKERKDVLFKIKEESTKSEFEFLEKKRIQQYMESCYEIREALRRKETQNVKICQLEQMVERERTIKRERALDKFWMDTYEMNSVRDKMRQTSEDCLKRKLALQTKFVLDMQMQEQELKRTEERDLKAAEAAELEKLLEEIRLEEFEKLHQEASPKKLEYRKELQAMIKAKQDQKRQEFCENAREHRKMCEELQRLEREESAVAWARRRAFHQATMDYIAYMKRMHKLEADAQKMRDNRIDDLQRVDICTKRNIQAEVKRKAEIAALCHAELKRQICEQYERNIREEAERRECKMLENRFARPEKTRADILAERRKNREGLDKQIVEMNRIREEQEAQYKDDLRRAINDPVFCAQLAEQYIREGVDYLEPHANWRILACPLKEYVPKKHANTPVNSDDVPPEGRKCSRGCIVPCGCAARSQIECALRPFNSFGDGYRQYK